jgi:hypothetical protein
VAEKHPYASPGAVIAAVNQFRKSFPQKVAADTLRKLGIAPNNESYVINTLRFVDAIDAEGNKSNASTAAFNQHEDQAFQKSFREMVKKAYAELFSLHGDAAWNLSLDALIAFFRNSDQTSDLVGRRQASTFQALASLAGNGDGSATSKSPSKPKESKPRNAKATTSSVAPRAAMKVPKTDDTQTKEVGLTVRIEVNLPAAADQETYDKIFRSIRENLLNGK